MTEETQQMEVVPLLPCPFCGKEARYVPADYIDGMGEPWPFAECDPCNVGAPVEFWNKRADKGQGETVLQWSDDDGLTWMDAKENEMVSARCAGWKTRTLYRHPAEQVCAHRFMSLADDPRRCADCDAVETHDEPVVRLELIRSGLSEGLHIRVWENLGNLWPGVHMLYLGPAEQPAPVAVVMPERIKHRAENPAGRIAYIKGWNARLDEFARLNPEPKP